MATLHGKEVEVGDKVWSVTRGWGLVTKIVKGSLYPFVVLYDDDHRDTYTESGKISQSHTHPTLFWEEMILTIKPQPVYEWLWAYSRDNGNEWRVTRWYYENEDEVRQQLKEASTRVISKIEPSKREVKS